ncbi:hypothetical protein ES319_1Z045700v1 [Gossypium barbadense]|uniref:Pectate lyase superfamily protein domain-containing protein n=1 Tax=Gossypium barbadense TaxID=3634 RepID=A0A5J5N8Y8_GOSBA|nr:hypothetical protein ES319_1Z045700v1 [Gossypium barbadense]
MFLKSHCLPLFITLFSLSLSSCLGSYKEHPLHPKPYHPYFHTFGVSNKPNYPTLNSGDLFNYNIEIRTSAPKIVNVDAFGAKANGRDDSQAFKKAWKYACSSQGATLVVPKKKVYHLKPIDFSGPCKSAISLNVTTVNHSDYERYDGRWLYFDKVQNLRVEGGGIINGNGRTWWENSCKINKALPCKEAPTAVTFNECNNLLVASLLIKNAQQMHLSFRKCVNVKAFNLLVKAPGHSPNTDGIHVTETQNININNCVIGTGDDCISIVSGSKNVRATGITCGPGHGISIGSLGARKSAAYVSNVLVNNTILSGTTNGVRIKTWQNYCDQQKQCPKQIYMYYIHADQVSAVRVSNVLYKNIRGTSASRVAMRIFLQDVALRPQEEEQEDIAKASCANVRLSYRGNVSPPCSS